MTSTTPSQRKRLLLAGVVLTLLLSAVFTLGSLDTPFEPRNWRDVLTLYAVSSFITAALIVFACTFSHGFPVYGPSAAARWWRLFQNQMVVGASAFIVAGSVHVLVSWSRHPSRSLALRPIEMPQSKAKPRFRSSPRNQKASWGAAGQARFHPGPSPRGSEKQGWPHDSADALWTRQPHSPRLNTAGVIQRLSAESH
jgi:hypothetical protein